MPTSPIPESDPSRDDPNEFTVVEAPMLRQLVAMGWNYIDGDLEYPQKTGRTSFAETILTENLKAGFRRVNLDHDGHEWLDDLTLDRAVRELTKLEGRGLLEMNQHFMQRLVKGVRVTIAEGQRSGGEKTLFPIAWVPHREKAHELGG